MIQIKKKKFQNEIVCFSISVIVDYPHMLVVIQTILLCYLTECLSILAYAWYWYSHIVQVPHPAYARVDNWLSRLETIYQYYDQPGMPTNCGKVLFELSLQHSITFYTVKNTAKRNMSSAVCGSTMYKSLAPTPLYMYSFALVVFAWKCRLFCLCVHVQCRVCYIYHVDFQFRFGHLTTFLV